ncbi:MAG: hypothetical protein ACFFE4_23450 [Candidatus Thorarchaeota archaeon]
MITTLRDWSELPKSVKLLDISIIGFILLITSSLSLYLLFIDQTVQNLMIIFLCIIILLLTWVFRSNLVKAKDDTAKKKYFREWVFVSIFFIVLVTILVLAYPVTYL